MKKSSIKLILAILLTIAILSIPAFATPSFSADSDVNTYMWWASTSSSEPVTKLTVTSGLYQNGVLIDGGQNEASGTYVGLSNMHYATPILELRSYHHAYIDTTQVFFTTTSATCYN